jgi:hypothetical protein
MLPNGLITIFDNEDTPPESTASRALTVALNFQTHTATLARALTHPGVTLLAPSQGNVQQLANGDELVGWGQAGYVSEFSATGALTFDMHLPPPSNTYRAYREEWSAQPTNAPAVAVSRGKGDTTAVYASWNGATGVASWRVLAGASAKHLAVVGTYARSGFETAMAVRTTAPYIAVRALGSGAQTLGTSHTVKD